MNILHHEVSPVFDENSRLLILGTFPSPKSRQYGFFYSHPQNRFWNVLSAVFDIIPPLATIEEKKAFLLTKNIAIWDVVKNCAIKGSSDASITNVIPHNLDLIFSKADIKAVFTTGGTASKLYRRFFDKDNIPLPSTSSANARMREKELIEHYRIIRRTLENI